MRKTKSKEIPLVQLRNILLMTGIYIIVTALFIGYMLEYVMGRRTLEYITWYLGMWIIFALICTISYLRLKMHKLKLAILCTAVYMICYIMTLSTANTQATYVYVIPYLILLLVYDNTKLLGLASGFAAIITLVTCSNRDFEYVETSATNTEISVACLVLVCVFLILTRVTSIQAYNRLESIEKELLEDTLTKCNNRKFLEHLVNIGFFKNKGITVVLGDINDFKEINDKCGHTYGDIALIRVGNALRTVCDKYSNTWEVRLGGDEFLIITDKPFVDDIIDQINDTIKNDVIVKDMPFNLEVSFGYVKNETGKMSWQQLYEKADAKMYEYKQKMKIGR